MQIQSGTSHRGATEAKKKSRAVMALRKALRRQAEATHGRPAAWFGGILYFTDHDVWNVPNLWRVPGVQPVPKPGFQVVGYEGAHPTGMGRTRIHRYAPEPKPSTTQRPWWEQPAPAPRRLW